MSKIIFALLSASLVLSSQLFLNLAIVSAQNVPAIKCRSGYEDYVQAVEFLDQSNKPISYVPLATPFQVKIIPGLTFDAGKKYLVKIHRQGATPPLIGFTGANTGDVTIDSDEGIPGSGAVTFAVSDKNDTSPGPFSVTLHQGSTPVCDLGVVSFIDNVLSKAQCRIKMPDNLKVGDSLEFIVEKVDGLIDVKYEVRFFHKSRCNTCRFLDLNNLPKGIFYRNPGLGGGDPLSNPAGEMILEPNNRTRPDPGDPLQLDYIQTIYNGTPLNTGYYNAVLAASRPSGRGADATYVCQTHPLTVSNEATTPGDKWTYGIDFTPAGYGGAAGGAGGKSLTCRDREAAREGVKCAEGGSKTCKPLFGNPNSGIQTAIGCVPTQPVDLVKTILSFVVAIAGGIAFLLMIIGAFGMITSAGNPDNLQAGKDRFTQALIGLLFVIFSVLLLQLIGVDILGIEGFGR